MTENRPPISDEYWDAVRSLDRERAWVIATRLLDDDRAADVVSAVRSTQERVGEAWMLDQMSVPEEHVATAINDAILGLVESRDNPTAGTKGAVALFCVEHEWHSMPARLFALELRAAGWKVVFFGASLPNHSIGPVVATKAFNGIAVSCTLPTNLFSVRDLTAALAQRSAPIIGGGQGFGPDGRWARAAGVDAYASDAAAASEILATWIPGEKTSAGPSGALPGVRLGDDRSAIIDAALGCLADALPTVAAYDDRQRRHLVNDLGSIIEHLDAAALADDDQLFVDFATWHQSVLVSRGVPANAFPIGLRCLATIIRDPVAIGRLRTADEQIGVTK